MSSVFKYCAPQQHYFDMLRANQVNCSHPRFLNDRYELAEYLIEPYQDFCLAIGWGQRHGDIFDNQAIASFANGVVANNENLWKEYAKEGTGFAVEYDKDKMTLKSYDRYYFRLQDVYYINGHVDLNDFEYVFDSDDDLSIQDCIEAYNNEGDLRLLDSLIRHLRLTKDQSYWVQEAESRIVIGQINHSQHLHKTPFGYNLDLLPKTIKSITLGYNMEDGNRRVIEAIAHELSVPVFH